ncbi:hypothetical protein F5Y05DRAFT_216761 [Hypoxylon sp. FL0543]|nr:hypothetical protein F5Y05DRAFT_216761 [Hypoxylon sp. FL0543]
MKQYTIWSLCRAPLDSRRLKTASPSPSTQAVRLRDSDVSSMHRGTSSNSRSPGLWRGRGPWSGNWRGRGNAIRRGANQASKGASDSPFGRIVAEITLDSASGHGIQAEDAKISDCRYVASYSLVASHSPKIIIPGQPATWKPPQLPCQLPGDHGDYLRDQNGARFPNHPLQPSVQSLFALNKSFDPSSVDILGCASSLGDILRFTRSVESTFRFDVEMVGNTLFLIRNHRKEVIPDVRGYGHSFLDNFTSHQTGMEETESHQRLVSYSFGGLRCLVRFECDGHFVEPAEETVATDNGPRISNLSEPLASGSISVERAGAAVPQHSILEIKTKSQVRGPVDMNEHLPRLWVRQIPNLITAYHVRGEFAEVEKKSVRQDVLKWEREHESELRKFASVLHQLITEVKRAGHLKLELCRTGVGPLELREQSGKAREVLPDDWKNMWAGRLQEPVAYVEARLSDDDDDESYPSLSSQKGKSSESDGSDDDFSLDYTACDFSCGYCGHCA